MSANEMGREGERGNAFAYEDAYGLEKKKWRPVRLWPEAIWVTPLPNQTNKH